MLPGPDSVWSAYFHCFFGGECTHDVGNKAVFGPVSTTYHIPRTGRCKGNPMLFVVGRRKERTPIRGDYELGTRFTVAVRIVPAELVRFAVRPNPLFILVAFVRCDHYDCTNRITAACRFKKIDGTDDISGIRANRIIIGIANQCLRSQVKYNLRAELPDDGFQPLKVENICDLRPNSLRHPGFVKETRISWWNQGYTANDSAQFLEPER